LTIGEKPGPADAAEFRDGEGFALHLVELELAMGRPCRQVVELDRDLGEVLAVDAILRHLATADRSHHAVHRARQLSPPFPEFHAGSRRLCGVCSWR